MSLTFVSEVKHPSLYLRQFLPNSEKGLPTPRICFVRDSGHGGAYNPPGPGFYLGNRYVDCEHGLIEVNEGTFTEDVIAHEWRHHRQIHAGLKPNGNWQPELPYFEAIRRYFTESWSEMDALLYSWKRTGFILESWRETLQLTRACIQ